jgi:hypothetical protein
MARPTKFKKRYIQDMIDFFDIAPQRKEVMKITTEYNKDGTPRKSSEEWKYIPNQLPTIYGFAKSIKVAYWTVWNWAEKGEDEELESKMKSLKQGVSSDVIEEAALLREFSKTYKTAKAAQQEFLMAIGLSGAAPSSAYIFTAKNVTKMRDKVEQEVSIRQVKPLLDNLKLDNVKSDENSSE